MPVQRDQWGNEFHESYGEVDDDKPYMPAELDWQKYGGQQGQYENWLKQTKGELESTGGVGAAAMRSGLNQAQTAMQAQAVGRGANPGNERAALYAGSQMQRQGALDAAQMTASEYAQVRGMEDVYRRQNVQDAMQQQAMEMQRQQMMSNNYNAAVGADIQQTNSDWSNYSGLVGTVVGAAAGAASDVRVKQNLGQAGGEQADAMIRGLSQSTADQSNAAVAQSQQRAAQATQSQTGGLMGGVASDVRLKQSIGAPSDEQQDAMMRATDLYQYDYRPEYQDWAEQIAGLPAGAKQGRQTGIMAQDLERTPLGQTMVSTDPQTGMKAIDGGQAVTTTMGLVGRLGERADELEARLAELEAQRQAASSRKGQRRG